MITKKEIDTPKHLMATAKSKTIESFGYVTDEIEKNETFLPPTILALWVNRKRLKKEVQPNKITAIIPLTKPIVAIAYGYNIYYIIEFYNIK